MPITMSVAEVLEWLDTYNQCPDFVDVAPAAGFDEGCDSGWSAAVDALKDALHELEGSLEEK